MSFLVLHPFEGNLLVGILKNLSAVIQEDAFEVINALHTETLTVNQLFSQFQLLYFGSALTRTL